MTTEPDPIQKAKMFALLQYIVPLSTLVFAGIIWLVMDDEISRYICTGLGILATVEFFTLRYLATKMERQAQRDRG